MRMFYKLSKIGLHNKLALLSVLLIAMQTVFLAVFSISYLEQEFERQVGNRALAVAQTLAKNPIIQQGLFSNNSAPIQAYVEPIRKEISASFIVVGDVNGNRYSHPEISKINQSMIGGDSIRALRLGESYISKAEGSLGVSIRGKTPVFSPDGDIIGLISVGYLEDEINLSINNLRDTFSLVFGVFLLAGGGLALYISKRYRDEIFGLEPEEISRVYSEREAVLESILEGIIVIDMQGNITSCNRVALEVMAPKSGQEIIGASLANLLPDYQYLFSGNLEKSWRDIDVDIKDNTLIMSKIPLIIRQKQHGVVVSFRRKDDIVELSQKLSQVKQFSTMLRVQTHEYSNKLNTIGGLIQIGSYDEALDLITGENSGYQELIAFLMRTIPDPIIAGLILGKYDVAKERKIDLIIDKDSSLTEIPARVKRSKLVTIVGNILENAFDASIANGEMTAQVKLSITDLGPDLIFEIEDSGCGMSDIAIKDIFTFGQSTKNNMGHGIGMFLVKNCLDQMEASLSITRAKTGGTIMTVYIPKNVTTLSPKQAN